MKIKFLGADHEVTGSCTLLQTGGHNILIDCGMEQGADIYENCAIPVKPSEIDCILLTHAHIDHSGKLPAITAAGFSGPIYSTEASMKLCNIMLLDSAHIQESEAISRNKKAKREGKPLYKPLYTSDDVEETLNLFKPCSYNQPINIFDNVSIRFIDSGHLLGSASIEITASENGTTKTILFSGDIGNNNKPLIRNPQKPDHADYVIIESTYGDRLHNETQNYVDQLTSVIQETLDSGGNIVIPSFAIGRTQELLYLIHQIKDQNLVHGHPGFPVWVDSPLAVEATTIYDDKAMMPYYDDETVKLINEGYDILHFDGLHTSVTVDDSKKINDDKTPKVILSASGMCEAGRIRHHLKYNLWRPESTILFVGFQAEGTLGRNLLEGAKTVNLFGEEVVVKAQITNMEGTSSHADKNMLLDWIRGIKEKPTQVFVNHGDDIVCDEFAESIKTDAGFNALAPYNGAEYDLLTNTCLDPGNKVRINQSVISKVAENAPASAPSHVQRPPENLGGIYQNLVKSGQRLMAIIVKNRGGSNRSLEKFKDQLDDLCSRWDRD